jgi:S-adenosylmethionine synthetase
MRVEFNVLDQIGMDLARTYVSVLGTSAEDADSGEVGRGNEVNGLICLNRPRGAEAASGKNPLSHVGKIYNVLAHHLADRLHQELQPVKEAIVWLSSRIGEPIDQPFLTSVQVRLERGANLSDVVGPIRDCIRQEFGNIGAFCSQLAAGKYRIY